MKNLYKTLKSYRKPLALTALVASAAVSAVGCGKQAYVVTASQAPTSAPGSFSVAPKVDILLVQDDTGSSIPIFINISNQLATFLSSLQTQGWDYHLATIPLTSYRSIQQVQASQYDPNWGSSWIPPYPGALASNIESVSASAFRLPSDYSDFLNGSNTSSASGGAEPGLANLETMLRDPSMKTSGFLRPDAILAVVLLSTGDDTSNRNFCSGNYASTSVSGAESCDLVQGAKNGTDPSIPCGQPGANPSPYCNNYQSSLQPYETFLQNFKGAGNSQQIRFYSVVSAEHQVYGETCADNGNPGTGTNAFLGARYEAVAGALSGQSYDICTVPIPTVLTSIASNLSPAQLDLYTSYLFMAQQPDPSTITVYRNPGGDTSQAVLIPQDPNNGWTFAGTQVTNVYTTSVGSPTATPTLNLGSGWAVQLHGTGIIGGTDTATVNFTPAGVQNSAAQ